MSSARLPRTTARLTSLLTAGAYRAAVWLAVCAMLAGVSGGPLAGKGSAAALPVCGNGIVTPPEWCDDGNLADGDGCNADCGGPSVGPPQVTIDDYPKIDGSTSTLPLARVIACELLGLDFQWVPWIGDEGASEILAVPKTAAQQALADAVNQKIVHNKTHQAYLNLVDAKADLILVANPPSADETAYAQTAGVTLKWQPVALDALVMLVNSSNPVTTLTQDQIRGIFMAQITDWTAVGGSGGKIDPYVRPINSGSQQLFNAIVMTGLTMPTWPPDQTSSMMGGLLDAVAVDDQSIGYSVYYYVTYQRPTQGAKTIAVDGVMPTAETIGTRVYPFTAPVLAVIRENLDRTSLAYQMRAWLLTAAGQAVVAKSGYVPVSGAPSGCAGDCRGDNQVTVDEILTMVNIALRNADISACTAGDASGDSAVTVDEILMAVNNALNGCPAPPTPSPSITPTPRPTNTPPPTVTGTPPTATPSPICVPPPGGIITWYPGEDSAADIVGPNSGTLVNGTTFTAGVVGRAFLFDGFDDGFQAPATGMPVGNSARTIEGWVRIDAVSPETIEAAFFGYGSFGNLGQTFALGSVHGTGGGGKLFVSQWGEGVSAGPNLAFGIWYHVAATNIGNAVSLYLNGALVGSTSMGMNTPPDTSFIMGRIPAAHDQRRLTGAVDEVAVYNRALGANEILAIYHAGGTGKCRP